MAPKSAAQKLAEKQAKALADAMAKVAAQQAELEKLQEAIAAKNATDAASEVPQTPKRARLAAVQIMREENPDDIIESDQEEPEEDDNGEVSRPPQSSSPGPFEIDEDEIPFEVQRSPARAGTKEASMFNKSTPQRNPMRKKVASPKTPKKSHFREGRRASVSPVAKGKKDTLGNLSPCSRPIGKTVSKFFRLKMATRNAYPRDADLTKVVFECLKDGLAGHADVTSITKRFKKDIAFSTIVTDIAKRGRWQLRGEVWRKGKGSIGGHYQLPGSLSDKPQELKKKVEKLKHLSTFSFKGLNLETFEYDKLSPYSHPIILEILIKQWFSSSKAEGAKYPDWFNPMPLTAIALVLTVIEAAIRQYETGHYVKADFQAELWNDRYKHHLDGLEKLKNRAPSWTAKWQEELFKACCEHAKIAVTEEPQVDNTEIEMIDFAALEDSV